jgi:hypothetical protein
MPRRGVEGSCGGIVAEVVLYVPVLVELADEGNGLISGSEGPLDGADYGAFVVSDPNLDFFQTPKELEAKVRFSQQWRLGDKEVGQSVLRRGAKRPRVTTGRLLRKLARMACCAGLGSDKLFCFCLRVRRTSNGEANSNQTAR